MYLGDVADIREEAAGGDEGKIRSRDGWDPRLEE
jgi:hypothetical protein